MQRLPPKHLQSLLKTTSCVWATLTKLFGWHLKLSLHCECHKTLLFWSWKPACCLFLLVSNNSQGCAAFPSWSSRSPPLHHPWCPHLWSTGHPPRTCPRPSRWVPRPAPWIRSPLPSGTPWGCPPSSSGSPSPTSRKTSWSQYWLGRQPPMRRPQLITWFGGRPLALDLDTSLLDCFLYLKITCFCFILPSILLRPNFSSWGRHISPENIENTPSLGRDTELDHDSPETQPWAVVSLLHQGHVRVELNIYLLGLMNGISLKVVWNENIIINASCVYLF